MLLFISSCACLLFAIIIYVLTKNDSINNIVINVIIVIAPRFFLICLPPYRDFTLKISIFKMTLWFLLYN